MRRKYILAILLAASQLAFFACSDKTNNDQPDNISESAPAAESETEVDYLSQLPEANFEGYSFNILTLSPEICVGIQSFYAEEENGEIINDTVYKRNAYVEEKYNIEIGCEESGSVVSTAIKLVESNDNTFDIFSDELKRCLANSTHGIFYNILDIDPIDLSKPWWYNDVAEIMTIKVKLYAAYSDINTQIKERIACEFVNLDIIGDYSLDNPYQLVSEGKWTLDAMNYMSKTVADVLLAMTSYRRRL